MALAAALLLAALLFSRGQQAQELPITAEIVSATPAATPTPAAFYPSLDFEAKVLLVKKYGPSICFGKVDMPTDAEVAGRLAAQPKGLVDEVKRRFGAASDFQAWERLEQFDQVVLFRNSYSSFSYMIEDGQCCYIVRRFGTLNASMGFLDAPSGVQTQQIPC